MLPAIPTPIPMPFAQNGERRAIPETNTTPGSADASWATGFPPVTRINKQAGGKPPYGLDFQGIFHTICEHLFFAQSGNTVPWVGANDGGPGLNYFKGAIVQGSDGEVYMALKPSGPDAPNPEGGGMVGPVDPVGDESGHWINLNLLYGGMPNSEELITESGTFTAPVAGWFHVRLQDGGDGGYIYTTDSFRSFYGGSSGKTDEYFLYFNKGDIVPVTIGAGGTSLIGTIYGQFDAVKGGATSFGDYVCRYDNGFFGDIYRNLPLTGYSSFCDASGAGPGGRSGSLSGTLKYYGSGGTAMLSDPAVGLMVEDGGAGCVIIRHHDPAKAAGPILQPALLSARRMAPRAVNAPATVNLYDPETGQGSVWRVEDAEAKLAEGMITEAAWLETCQAKAAEERAAWLADPETEAERFVLLRAARDAKLAEHDVQVVQLQRQARAGADVADDLAAWDAYAVALCDLPAQEGAPWDGGGELTPWPAMPTVSKVTAQE